MIINLNFKAKLDKNIKLIYDNIAFRNIDEFNNLFEDLNKANFNKFSWWTTQLSSRNTLASPLFHNLCCIELVDYLSKTNKNYIFKTNLRSLYKILLINHKENKKLKFILINKKFLNTKIFLLKRINLIKCIINKIIQSVICKIASTIYNKKLNKAKIQIIDLAITPNFIDSERQYNIKNFNNFYIVPRLLLFKFLKNFSIIFYLINNNKNYFFRENNIYLIDYFKIYSSILDIKNFKLNIQFKKINIKELIEEEINQEINNFQKVEALITFYSFKNISKNISISKSINWYENQIIDKFWNLSLNTYHENCKTIGWKGTVPSQLLFSQNYTLYSEFINKMTPKIIYMMGQGYIKDAKRFCKNIDVRVVAALRHRYLKKIRPLKLENDEIKIFLALPCYDSNQRIIDMIKESIRELKIKVKIYYKFHPIDENRKINITDNFIESNDTFKNLEETELIITGMSSLSLEGICIGRFVINIPNEDTFNFSTIPKNIPNFFWKDAYDSKDMKKILKNYCKSRKKDFHKRNIESDELIKNYFNFINEPKTLNIFENE